MYGLARPLLFSLDAESAHGAGLKAIEAAYRLGLNPLMASKPKSLPVKLLGLEFSNPVGLAAGLDLLKLAPSRRKRSRVTLSRACFAFRNSMQ